MTPEEAFDDWFEGYPIFDLQPEKYVEHMRAAWVDACKWQGQTIARAQIKGWQEAWLAPDA